MEDAQIRRRRPITYGKPARRRFSDIDDIFSSPSVSRSRTPSLTVPTTKVTKANSSTIKNATGFQFKRRSAPKSLRTNPTTATAPEPKPTPHITELVRNSEESEGYSDKAVAAQLFNEERLSRGDNLAVFDIPSSDNEKPSATRHILKRKRAPPKSAPNRKARATDNLSALRPTPTELENMTAKTKRPRLARKPEETTAAGSSNKLTSAGKMTKPLNRFAPPKGKEKAATAIRQQPLTTQKPVNSDVKLSCEQVAVPPRVRMTRSQSRQLSEEPPAVGMQPTAFEGSKQNPSQTRKVEVVIPSSPCGKAPNAASEPKHEFRKLPKPLSEKNLKAIPEESPPQNVAAKKARTNRPVGKAQKVARSTNGICSGEPLNDVAHDISPIVKPRKRVIEISGVGQAVQRKKSRSPTASDVSDRLNSQESSQDTDIYGFRSQSDPQSQFQDTCEPEQQSSQEIKIITVQRQMLGNGKTGPRITYARERSYRMEEATGNLEDILNMPLPSITPMRPTRRRLEHPKPPVRDRDIEGMGKRPKGMIKSIHELRVAGEHSRFIDDVEDLFLDIEGPCALGTKRSGYFELTNRLLDKSFKQKFRSNSFDERLLTKMDLQTDEIITFALSYLTLCFLHEDFTPRIMLQVCNNGIVPMLARMLASTRDISVIAKDRKTNMSKAALSQVADLRALLEKSATFQAVKAQIISPQILALKVLEKLVRRFREHGSSDEILDGVSLRGLVNILSPFTTSKEYPKSLQTHSFQLLELPISTLEAYTLGGYCSLEGQISSDELISLTNLFSTISGWTTDEDLGPLLLLLLRLNINITNNRPMACETLANQSFIITLVALIKGKFEALSGVLEEQERLLSIDLLILSLGLMMNFAEFSPKARAVVGDQVVPSLEGNPLAVDVLLDTFLNRLGHVADADSMEESHTNVAFGYLAVLLGDLCQEDHIRYTARARLPNSSLKPLLSAVEEFVAHHRKVDCQLGVEEFEDEPVETVPQAEFTARLQDVMMRLRAYA